MAVSTQSCAIGAGEPTTVPAPRIVSLLPSITEIVVALGLGDKLVGRSHQCDFPPWVAGLPALSASRLEPGGSAGMIHQRVNALLAAGQAMYEVDAESLWTLAPNFILTQTQCAVCAVTPGDLQAAIEAWPAAAVRPEVLAVEPEDLGQVWQAIGRVATALGVAARGVELVTSLQTRLAALTTATRGRERPSVVTLEWTNPLMAAGNWMPELIEAAGGHNRIGVAGEHSACIEMEQVAAADPDVILLTPCGFTLEQGAAALAELAAHPLWSGLRAVDNGAVYLIDGVHYFNRPGPRLVESAEIVAEILHPGCCDFGHRGTAWVPASV
ncbi:MAG TPA: cobalamin-binding protein [Rhodanobacteraceae bacterium]|nr:cobalamin-binding protein [Rhodanobacteraceae bacterium]